MSIIEKPGYEEAQAEYNSVLSHFNWGAFVFDWMWGLANGCLGKMKIIFLIYILMLIPLINIIAFFAYIGVKIYFGIKGNEWAYDGRAFYNPKDFEDTQNRWGIAALCTVLIPIALSGLLGASIAVSGISPILNSSNSNNMSSTAAVSPLNNIVKDIIDGETKNGTFTSSKDTVDYLLNNSEFIAANNRLFTVDNYGSNGIQLYTGNTIFYTFIINKNTNCSLEAKNCSITLYPVHAKGEKVTASEKVYFDNSGTIKKVKFKK